jgi:hypothetical protein
MASNVSHNGVWHCPTFYQFNGFREAPVAHRINTYFDNFGYHLPFFHPTGEFGLEYEQCAKALGDTRNVVGT